MTKLIAVLIALTVLEATAFATPTAEDLYAEGKAAYDRTDYATAITSWQASYNLSGANGLLFNLAQAQRLSGDCPRALTTYKQFMAADPDPASEQHKLALDFALELEPACGVRPAPITVLPVFRQPVHERSGQLLRVTGIVAGGTGAAIVVAGLLLGHHGAVLGTDVTRACAISCDWSAQQGNDAAGRRDVTIGRVLDVAGAVGILGGVALYYVGMHEGTISVVPRSEGGAIASWSRAW